jgi:hypothetical protein
VDSDVDKADDESTHFDPGHLVGMSHHLVFRNTSQYDDLVGGRGGNFLNKPQACFHSTLLKS